MTLGSPQLARFYETHKDKVEVVSLSCDQDEDSFDSYLATMPWTAVPFGATARDKIMAHICATGCAQLGNRQHAHQQRGRSGFVS